MQILDVRFLILNLGKSSALRANPEICFSIIFSLDFFSSSFSGPHFSWKKKASLLS